MVAESKKFQVGDKVITVKNTPTVQEGWIGFVTRNEAKYGYEVYANGSTGEEAFFEHELELLSVNNLKLPPNLPKEQLEYYHQTMQKLKPDAVNHPKHYAVFEQLEAIEVIASSMTTDQFYGYCLGNILKYRLRAGGKDDVMQELGKADKYQELFTKHKPLCKDAA